MRRFPMMETNRCVAGLGEAEDGVRSGMARVRQSMLGFFSCTTRGSIFDPSRHPIMQDSVGVLGAVVVSFLGYGIKLAAGAIGRQACWVSIQFGLDQGIRTQSDSTCKTWEKCCNLLMPPATNQQYR